MIALGIFIAIGASTGALQRLRRRAPRSEPRASRALAALATHGLVAGCVAIGVYYYAPPLHPGEVSWLTVVAAAGFATAIAGYGLTLLPTACRAFFAD